MCLAWKCRRSNTDRSFVLTAGVMDGQEKEKHPALELTGDLERLVQDVPNVVVFDGKTGRIVPKLFRMPAGEEDAYHLVDNGDMPSEFRAALEGVYCIAGQARGNTQGLRHKTHIVLSSLLGGEEGQEKMLCSKKATQPPLSEAWHHGDEGGSQAAAGASTVAAITGEGMKSCFYATEAKAELCALNGMHEGKTERTRPGEERMTSQLTREVLARNVLGASGTLRPALNNYLHEIATTTGFAAVVDEALGTRQASRGLTLDSEHVLVFHANWYGDGEGAVVHNDFEGSRWRAQRLEGYKGVMVEDGDPHQATRAKGACVRPGDMGLEWRPDAAVPGKMDFGAGDGVGRVIWTLNMNAPAWVVIGLPGCMHKPQKEKPPEYVADSFVRFLVMPGCMWGMSAGTPCEVQFGSARVDVREHAVVEYGCLEVSRNLVHGVCSADTMGVQVRTDRVPPVRGTVVWWWLPAWVSNWVWCVLMTCLCWGMCETPCATDCVPLQCSCGMYCAD